MAYQGVDNHTPYTTEPILLADENGRDVLVVLVKATYQISAHGGLELTDDQAPPDLGGEYFGEPGESSLKIAPEGNFIKLATDIALIGHAQAPAGRAVTELDVSLKVGERSKTVRVFGDRVWKRVSGLIRKKWVISEPQPYTVMPLTYERAFGGKDLSPEDQKNHAYDPRNPIGAGLIAKESLLEEVPLPNLEDPASLIQQPGDRPAPAGFGFISPHWEPRLSHAGTYDESWQDTRMPLLPEDFNRKFFNAAHPDLVAGGFLKGDEEVEIINASPSGRLHFRLPGVSPAIAVTAVETGTLDLTTFLDSVVIDTDDYKVQLLWRGSVEVSLMYNIVKIEVRLADTSVVIKDQAA